MNPIIEAAEEVLLQAETNLPLSPEQQSLLLNRGESSLPALALVMKIQGELDQPRLVRAMQQVLKSQRILASKFFNVAAYRGLRQSVVRANQPWPLEYLDALIAQNKDQEPWQYFNEQVEIKRQAGFTQQSDWLAKLYLCQIDENSFGLALIVADLITDKGGLQAFWQALATAYQTDESLLAADEELPQYAEYIEWRVDMAQDEDATAGKEYWQHHIAQQSQAPTLPYRHTELTTKASTVSYSAEKVVVDSALQGQLTKLAQQLEQPITLVLQATWWWLLARISEQRTIQVGWSHDCRLDYEFFNDNVGLFAKTLPLSLTISDEQSLSNWLETVAAILEEHQAWQEHWSVESPSSTTHLAYGFALEQIFTAKIMPDSQWHVTAVNGGELPFELSLLVGLCNEQASELTLCYQDQHYAAMDIKVLLAQYHSLLVNITSELTNTPNSITDVSLAGLSSSEAFISKVELKNRQHFESTAQVTTANNTIEAPSTLGCYISAWAKNQPSNNALTSDVGQLTYEQLEQKVAQLAIRLHHQGVTADSVVALALPRSINLVVAILATWRVGAAWVPLDLQWPMLRKCLIVEQSAAVLIISDSGHWSTGSDVVKHESSQEKSSEKSQVPAKVLLLDEAYEQTLTDVEFNVPTPQQAAYIIFTSGSTGIPKGVVIEHRQLLNYVTAATKQLGLADCKNYAMTSTVAADLGHTSFFGALFNGATLHIASDDEVQDGARFAQFMQTHQIDCLKIVPSHLNALLELDASNENITLPSTLILGGEPISASLVASIFTAQPNCRLFNHYGPTEATVGVLYHQLHADDNLQHGIALSNTFDHCQVIILDEKMQRVPTGALGELYIGGRQLCRGYLSAAENAFIDDPFNRGERLYPSGDLARYLANGNVLLCGRRDHQVKIRGFRIELAEVEQVLLNEEDIAQAVVCAWQPGENKAADNLQLIAYVQRARLGEKQAQQQNSDAWLQQIIAHLPEVLPVTMLPTHVFELDNIPRLANGKIDRKNLPSPESLLITNEFIEPASGLETFLAKEMALLLNLEKISTQLSFFSLGGHSLLIIKLVSILRKQLQVDIHPGVVFDNPSVVALAKALSNEKGVIAEKLERTAQVRLKLNSLTPQQREALLARSKAVK